MGAVDDRLKLLEKNDMLMHEKKYIETPLFKRTFDCPYCNSCEFTEFNDLVNHIKQKHNSAKWLLKINGKIIDKEVVLSDIFSVKVVKFTDEELLLNNEVLNIDNEFIDTFVQEKFFENDLEFQFLGEVKKVKKISFEQIDECKVNNVINKWNFNVRNNKSIKYIKEEEYNTSEIHYLNGFYNYFIACNASENNKSQRYEEAFSILSENAFKKNDFVLQILQIICFKYNWKNYLFFNKNDSVLCNIMINFLNNSFYESNYLVKNDNDLYIEEELEKIIKIISSSYDEIEHKYLNDLRKYSFSNDVNTKDKIYILLGRFYLYKKNIEEAKYYYNEVKSPCFLDEVKIINKTEV